MISNKLLIASALLISFSSHVCASDDVNEVGKRGRAPAAVEKSSTQKKTKAKKPALVSIAIFIFEEYTPAPDYKAAFFEPHALYELGRVAVTNKNREQMSSLAINPEVVVLRQDHLDLFKKIAYSHKDKNMQVKLVLGKQVGLAQVFKGEDNLAVFNKSDSLHPAAYRTVTKK